MKHFHHLLVGVDFSPICVTALKTAVRLAEAHEAKLTVVHAMDPWLAEELKHAFNYSDEQLTADLERKVYTFMEESGISGQTHDVSVKLEHPVVAMQQVAADLGADLLVLGTRGSDHGPNEMGAVAAKTVRKAALDVLLVRAAHEGPFHRVTACVDFSTTSARALHLAASLAAADNAKLTALHVCQSPMMLSRNYTGFLPSVTFEERVVANEARRHLDHFVAEVLKEDAQTLRPATQVVEHVSIREALVSYLSGSHGDLLVLGSHGRSQIKDFLIGTAAETMVKNASCSVLVVTSMDGE